MDQVRLKIAPQSNGNHIRNTLRFLYWLSGGIILYLLCNSSETRDKCKLKLFFTVFCKALYHAYVFSYLIPDFFLFYWNLKILHHLPASHFALSRILHPFPSSLSHRTLFFQVPFKFVGKRRNGRTLVFSRLFHSVLSRRAKSEKFFFLTAWHAVGLRYCWVHSMPIEVLLGPQHADWGTAGSTACRLRHCWVL
jgi:hypothetical protein